MPPSTKVKTKKRAPADSGNIAGLALVAGAAALAIWWRKRSAASNSGSRPVGTGSRSAFRFPSGKRGAASAPAQRGGAPVPRPPGPPGSHKKKSKAQKAADRAARAGKREAAAVAADVDKARTDPKDPNNTLILNYSYYDSARRDTATAARAQQQGGGGNK